MHGIGLGREKNGMLHQCHLAVCCSVLFWLNTVFLLFVDRICSANRCGQYWLQAQLWA